MGNENMRDRPENPAEDPLAELARLMAQEDDLAALTRKAPQPAPTAPPRPAPPRRPAEEGRPAAGSFAALAAEVYGEGVPRAAPMARSGAEEATRDTHRDPARGDRPVDPRAPHMPPRPQATEAVRRAPLSRPEAPSPSSAAPSPAAIQPLSPRAAALRPAGSRAEAPLSPARPSMLSPDAPRQEALRQEALRQDAARQEAARQEAARQEAARQEAARQEAGRQGQEAARQEALRQQAARQEALRREALRQEAVRQEAARREAASREAARAQPASTARAEETATGADIPAWMTRATAAARASTADAAMAAPPAASRHASAPQAFDLDEDAYDYGRSASDHEPGPEAYEEYETDETAPAHRSRRRLLMIGGALVVFIGAAAVGYVLVSGPSGSGPSGEPPIIRADQGPNKVVPNQPAQEQTADGQKLIYDRVGGSATTGNEQVVSSEEQPVDVSQAAQPQPRVIQTTPSGSASPASSGEPKRVRTLTVRADGTVVEDTSPPASPLPPGASAEPAGGADRADSPVALNLGTGGAVPTTPAPLSSTPSIVDNMPDDPPPAPAPRVAAAPAPAASPSPAASSASVPAGAYVVQIAAVRSEAEAQATWRGAQAKYGMLANQPLSVKRADLGDRGIFYRVQAGSFGAREGAVDLCEALRAQGGNCMVVRN